MNLKYILHIIFWGSTFCISAQSQVTGEIDKFLQETYKKHVIPGFSVVVVKNDRVIFSGAYGYENQEKRIRYTQQSITGIGSITKSFTALAIMQLCEKGKVELEAPVTRYLPWFRTANNERSDKITVRMLLNNTSGLHAVSATEHDLSDKALEKLVRALKGTYLSRDPGTSYEYSNTAFCVAGLIIQTLSGQPFSKYMKENILNPLQMHHTSFEPGEQSRSTVNQGHYYGIDKAIPAIYEPGSESAEYIPAGSLAVSCARDMGNYLIALLNKGYFMGKAVIGNKSLELMQAPQISFPGVDKSDGGDGSNFFYGLGWVISRIDGRQIIHHAGSTGKSSSMTLMDLKNNIAVSVLMNIDISFIDKYHYCNAINLANNILHVASAEKVTAYGLPKEADPTLNTNELNDSSISNYEGHYFLLSGGDNVVFHNVKLRINRGSGKQLQVSIARNRQLLDEFSVDFISPVYAVSRNIGSPDPVRFKLTPLQEVTGIIYRGMEFSKKRIESTDVYRRISLPDNITSIEIPANWSSQWNNNKLEASDPLNPEIALTAYITKKTVDLDEIVNKELNISTIQYRGLEHNESIAGRNWKEVSLITKIGNDTRQHLIAISKNEGYNIIMIFHCPGGKMTAALQKYFVPLIYSVGG